MSGSDRIVLPDRDVKSKCLQQVFSPQLSPLPQLDQAVEIADSRATGHARTPQGPWLSAARLRRRALRAVADPGDRRRF